MTSDTLIHQQLENHQQSEHWVCHVCRDGLLLAPEVASNTVAQWRSEMTPLIARDLPVDMLLLGGVESDVLTPEPPLILRLGSDELLDLRHANGPSITAATWFGPADQDKQTNQDFALTARLNYRGHGETAFAAVADGVSMRTFWAERASRLACLVAFQTVRSMSPIRSDADLQVLRCALAHNLRVALEADRDALMRAEATPLGWSEAVYWRNINRRELWYNSTLLIAFLGPHTGALLFVGDGGIVVFKTDLENGIEETRPLASTESLTIDQSVCLDVSETSFKAGLITDLAERNRIDVVLASDGVDRTLQRQNQTDPLVTYAALALGTAQQTFQQLRQLAELPDREFDNYSIARITWPLSAPAIRSSPAYPQKPRAEAGQRLSTGAWALAFALLGGMVLSVAVLTGVLLVSWPAREFSSDLFNRLQAVIRSPVVAIDDTLDVVAGKTIDDLRLRLLANDQSANDHGVRVVAIDNTLTHGQVIFDAAAQKITYEASGFDRLPAGQADRDGFWYSVVDSAGNRSTATVTIRVIGIPQQPVAANHRIAVIAGNRTADLTAILMRNTSDQYFAGLDMTDTTGRIEFDLSKGTLNYVAEGFADLPPGDTAIDQFRYRVRTTTGEEAEGMITLIVTSAAEGETRAPPLETFSPNEESVSPPSAEPAPVDAP